MSVVDRTEATASRNTDISGYGSRIALAALTCPGRREIKTVIARSEATKQSIVTVAPAVDCFAEPVIGRAFAGPVGSQWRCRLRSLSYGGQIAPRNDVEKFTTPRSRGAMRPRFCKERFAL